MKPAIGSPAPDFTRPVVGGEFGEEGGMLSLDELADRWVVLYFYPKDDTPGCTTQACALRDDFEALSRRALILGASTDDLASHRKFLAKHELPFALLADEDKSLVEAYGVWVEKSMYGKKYMGTERSTFVIDPEGRIAAVLEKIQPAKHVPALLGLLDELGA